MRGKIVAIALTANLLFIGNLFSQGDSVMYSDDFEFTEGIYMTFEEFKNNDPSIRKKAIITDSPTDQILIGDLWNHEKIAYYGPNGEFCELKRRKVWGYSSGRNVYIRSGMYFNRLFVIGSIMHFMEQYNNPLYGKGMGLVSAKKVNNVQCLIDYNTGDVLNYCFESFLRLLEKDPELYEEFTSIKKDRKKKEQMFLYLKKFNERHPIYFPGR